MQLTIFILIFLQLLIMNPSLPLQPSVGVVPLDSVGNYAYTDFDYSKQRTIENINFILELVAAAPFDDDEELPVIPSLPASFDGRYSWTDWVFIEIIENPESNFVQEIILSYPQWPPSLSAPSEFGVAFAYVCLGINPQAMSMDIGPLVPEILHYVTHTSDASLVTTDGTYLYTQWLDGYALKLSIKKIAS